MQGTSNRSLSSFTSFKSGKQCWYNRVQSKGLQVCGTWQFWPLPLISGAAELGSSIWLSKAGLSLLEVRDKRSNCPPVPGSLWVGSRDMSSSVTQPGCPSSPSTQVSPAETFQSFVLKIKQKKNSRALKNNQKIALSTSNLGIEHKISCQRI